MRHAPDGLHRLDEHCAAALAAHDCPSVSVAVAERGEVILAEAYGWADVTAERPATPQTAYAVASVTKPITATAVCLAADEGLLHLDSPVPVGGGHGVWPAPTVRRLLQHRGGLGAHYDFHYGDGARRVDADRYVRLYRRPGSGFEYSNLGYRLLGQVLESATGRTLQEFVRERVFEPLGLPGCHLGPSAPSGPGAGAVRYTVDGRAYGPVCDSSHPGASMGWATASEAALFAQSYGRLLKPETAAATVDALPVNARLGYGLGWCVSYGDGPVVLSHGGGMGGVAAMTVVAPEQQLSVAVLTNSTGKGARDAVVQYVLSALVPGFEAGQISPALPHSSRPAGLPHRAWAGRIGTPEGDVPVALRVLADGRAELQVAGESAECRVDASDDWDLRGVFPLQLPTADARLNSPLLGLEIRFEEGRLKGVARAYKDGDGEGRLGNMLSHPCELEPR